MPEPIPIAFCITELDPGGAERALVQLVSGLDRREWAPRVYGLGPRGPLADVLEQQGIPTLCLEATSFRSLTALQKLAVELKLQRPAILQTFLFHANVVGRIAARKAGVPIVVSGIRVAERGRRWHLWLERMTRHLVTHHVCVSQSVAEFSMKALGLPADRVTVIPNGVDFERFANAPPAELTAFGIPPGSKTLLFVGRLHRQKGVMTLIDAITPLVDQHPELHLLIVGDGPLRMVVEAMSESRRGQIHLLGRREDVPALMRSASALVLPSLWEGLPNVILEAMAAGLPVIATSVDGSRELVIPVETGWLVDPGSIPSLELALREWLNSEGEQLDRMGSAAQQFVQQEFTWQRVRQEYGLLYRQLLENRRLV